MTEQTDTDADSMAASFVWTMLRKIRVDQVRVEAGRMQEVAIQTSADAAVAPLVGDTQALGRTAIQTPNTIHKTVLWVVIRVAGRDMDSEVASDAR